MLEVLNEDYIRTARAKGLQERIVIVRHALSNGLIPILTTLAVSISSLFGGAVVTESVFSWPGVGRLLASAVLDGDYPTVQGSVLFISVLVALTSLIADVAYGLVDPRIRSS
jgi:peptide/nickel transport system permease protein